MAYWFEKDDYRRFPRVKMPVQVFIRPSQPLQEKQIFTYPANYLPNVILEKIAKTESELKSSIAKIQEQKEIIVPAFAECITLAHLFGEFVQNISQGQNPAYQKSNIQKLTQITQGFQVANQLKKEGPKTYQFFQMMDDKFITYSKNMIKILQKSTSQTFSLSDEIAASFKMDKIIPKFQGDKYQDIPLAKSLFLLSQLLNLYLATFTELLKEHAPETKPNKWQEYTVSISACGLSIPLNKDYPLNSKLNIGLYFPETRKSIRLKGAINRSVPCKKHSLQLNCLDFEFPDYQQQQFIENQQQIYQINSCLRDY